MVDFTKSGLVVCDMDSTLVDLECIDELAALVGKRETVTAITEQAMRGEIDFATSLRQRVSELEGLETSLFSSLFEPIPLMPGAVEMVDFFRGKSWYIAVVSGGFTWFTERLADALHLDAHLANRLHHYNGKLTGRVSEPVVDGAAKANFLKELAQRWSIPQANTIAIGDGANDLALLEAAGCGVAFCAKPKLKEIADVCIDTPDLREVIKHFSTTSIS